MSKGGCKNKSALLILFIFHSKNSQNSNLSLKKNNWKWGGGSHCEINAFSSSCWTQLLAPNYCNVLFPAQQLWVFLYNAWRVWRTPDKRSETISSSRISPDPSDSQLHDGASSLQFTSLMFYRVQVRGLEWPAEAWFCAQWPIFVLFLRFVFGLLYGWKIKHGPL